MDIYTDVSALKLSGYVYLYLPDQGDTYGYLKATYTHLSARHLRTLI